MFNMLPFPCPSSSAYVMDVNKGKQQVEQQDEPTSPRNVFTVFRESSFFGVLQPPLRKASGPYTPCKNKILYRGLRRSSRIRKVSRKLYI